MLRVHTLVPQVPGTLQAPVPPQVPETQVPGTLQALVPQGRSRMFHVKHSECTGERCTLFGRSHCERWRRIAYVRR